MADRGLQGNAYVRFEKEFTALYSGFKGKTVTEVSLTRQMMNSIRLAVNCGMVFEKGMFAIIKSMMYLDGMVLRCRPDADLIRDMRPKVIDFQKIMNEEERE